MVLLVQTLMLPRARGVALEVVPANRPQHSTQQVQQHTAIPFSATVDKVVDSRLPSATQPI